MQSGHVRPSIFAGRHAIALSLLLALATSVSPAARAENYPDRPVKIIVPFAAGGTADAIPRFVGDWLSRKWGQPVVIENRTGAAGNIGAEAPCITRNSKPVVEPAVLGNLSLGVSRHISPIPIEVGFTGLANR